MIGARDVARAAVVGAMVVLAAGALQAAITIDAVMLGRDAQLHLYQCAL